MKRADLQVDTKCCEVFIQPVVPHPFLIQQWVLWGWIPCLTLYCTDVSYHQLIGEVPGSELGPEVLYPDRGLPQTLDINTGMERLISLPQISRFLEFVI